MPSKSRRWTVSTSNVFAASLAPDGGTKCPMLRFLPVPASPQCTRCSDNVNCAGLAMCAVWKTIRFPRISSIVSLLRAKYRKVAPAEIKISLQAPHQSSRHQYRDLGGHCGKPQQLALLVQDTAEDRWGEDPEPGRKRRARRKAQRHRHPPPSPSPSPPRRTTSLF